MKKQKSANNNRIMLSIFIFACIFFYLLCHTTIAKANNRIEYDKEFCTIQIENNDTLSSIAAEYCIDGHYNHYIQEVKSINNLTSDQINSGCYLVIPTYVKHCK